MRIKRKAYGVDSAKPGSKIGSSSRKPIDRLNPKQRKYTMARASGKNITQSAAEAGISKRYGSTLEQDADVQAAYRSLIREAMPAEEVVRLIDGGSHADRTLFSPDGKKQKKVPDWKTRRPYIEMAAEHAGYVEKSASGGNTLISVVVEHVGATPPVSPRSAIVDGNSGKVVVNATT